MKTAEDWARKIEADPSVLVIREGLGGVMTASELWALAQTLGRELRATLFDDPGVEFYVNPPWTALLHSPFQTRRVRLAPQAAPRTGEAAAEEPTLPPCPQCARPNPVVDEGGVRCWWCGHQARTIEQYREGP